MPSHEDLIDAPQLAILDALNAVLDNSVAIILVQHPEIIEADGFTGLPPDVWVADQLALAMRDLQRLILRYRQAVIDDARYRLRPGAITPTSPPPHAD